MYVKPFEELTFQDNFIFQKVMLKKDICKRVLERLLNISIRDIVYIQEEKTLDIRLDTKSIRLDVYVKDTKGTVFNIEMQTSRNMEELVKRTRFYQSVLDMYHLQKGERYVSLNDTYIIFICTFSLFMGGLSKYTFRNICVENNSIELKDGATKLFLSTKGNNEGIPKSLQRFLAYIDGHSATDSLLKDIDKAVDEVKHSKLWKEEYKMITMEHYNYWDQGKEVGRQEGIKEGIKEGRLIVKTEIVLRMLKQQLPMDMIVALTELTVEEIQSIEKSCGD